jgi:hypothetical protein
MYVHTQCKMCQVIVSLIKRVCYLTNTQGHCIMVQTEVTEFRVSTLLKPKTSRIPNLDLSFQPKNIFPFDPFQYYRITCFPYLIWLLITELPDQTSVSTSGVFYLNHRYIAYSSLSVSFFQFSTCFLTVQFEGILHNKRSALHDYLLFCVCWMTHCSQQKLETCINPRCISHMFKNAWNHF